MQPVLRCDAAT